MAEKEAVVYIVDLGASTARCNNGRGESDLEWSMRYVWDKITDVVTANRKTLCVGVVGLRTDETDNKLQETDGYEHVSVLQELGPMNMSSLRALQAAVRPSSTMMGDAISAIVVAVDMIETFTKKLKYLRKIVLVTDGQGELDADDLQDIANKMNELHIHLTVLGVDFDEAEYGFKKEDKSPTKATNEATLKDLTKLCDDALFATMAEAVDALQVPRVKPVKPYKTYDGSLTLGDAEKSPAAMSINVERYFKTHIARSPGASTVVFKTEVVPAPPARTQDPDAMDGIDFSAVRQARTYKVEDPDAPGGKRDVEFESLAKGYKYGRTAVHISESEHNITKIETKKDFSIIGLIPSANYAPFMNMGEACVTYARRNDPRSEIALSSLVWALMELESYAIARIVTKDGKDPLLLVLAPRLEPEEECLIDVPLPFAEDVRTYQFPPLDKVITVSGQTVTKHRLLPSEELSKAMSDYVDAMDLSIDGAGDGGPTDYAPIEKAFNPSIHRVNQAVKARAAHPDKPVAEMAPVLLQFSKPPEELVQKAQKIESLIQAAEVKKVPPNTKRRQHRESIRPISGLDVDALLGEKRDAHISRENSIPDFKRALNAADEVSEIEQAAKQMAAIVRSHITDSLGDSRYAQALECIGAMREELTNLEEAATYNEFLRELKKGLLSGALGGDRRDFWFKLRWSRLGLIDRSQLESSTVSPKEADEFLQSR